MTTTSRSTLPPVRIAAISLDQAHSFGRLTDFSVPGASWPDTPMVEDPQELLDNQSVDLLVTAAVPDQQAPSLSQPPLARGFDTQPGPLRELLLAQTTYLLCLDCDALRQGGRRSGVQLNEASPLTLTRNPARPNPRPLSRVRRVVAVKTT